MVLIHRYKCSKLIHKGPNVERFLVGRQFLLLFNGFVGPRMRLNLGYVLIGLISIFLVYNGIIMLLRITRLCVLLLRKWRVHRRQRSLRAEANQVKKKIQCELDEISKEKVEAERAQIRL